MGVLAGEVCLPLVGNRMHGLTDQKNSLTGDGFLMEAATVSTYRVEFCNFLAEYSSWFSLCPQNLGRRVRSPAPRTLFLHFSVSLCLL